MINTILHLNEGTRLFSYMNIEGIEKQLKDTKDGFITIHTSHAIYPGKILGDIKGDVHIYAKRILFYYQIKNELQ